MTEQEWDRCTDPLTIFLFLEKGLTERQLRLFAAAYARRFWQVLPDERSRAAVEVAERAADGNATAEQLDHAWKAAYAAAEADNRRVGKGADPWARAVMMSAWAAVVAVLDSGGEAARMASDVASNNQAELAAQCDLLREIIGNPFRPVTVKPFWFRWQEGVVRKLARAIYDERRFEDLPILADALEEAGCTEQALLDHCRGPGSHCRGCWAVDLLVGRGRRGSTRERAARTRRPPRPWPQHPEGPKRFRRFAAEVPAGLAKRLRLRQESDFWHRLLVCSCGKKDAFELKYLGVLLPDGGIQNPEETGQKSRLRCRNCGTTIDLFDPFRHGHDGVLVFHAAEAPGRRANRKYACGCGGGTFSVLVSAVYDRWDDEEYQREFNESTQDESYGWFETHLLCSRCRKVHCPISYECR